jgi:probable HAF family extracellular repeat protein
MFTRSNYLFRTIGFFCAGMAALFFFYDSAVAITYYSWSRITLADGYSITPNSGWHVGPVMLNNNDQIAGTATNPSGALRAFLYSGGVTHDLGLLPGAPESCPSGTLIYSIAAGLNDQGQVVGGGTIECGKGHAFVSNGGSLVDLGSLDGGPSGASGINNAGAIVGVTEVSPPIYPCINPISHAFLYQGSMMTDLGIPKDGNICDSSGALAINNAGLIAGQFNGSLIVMDSSSAGGGWNNLGISMAVAAVNDSGQIAGYVGKSAHVYTPDNDGGELLYLGTLASYPGEPWCSAIDINNSGVVVGTCRSNSSENVATAWVYIGGVMTNLNELLVIRLPGSGGGLNLPDNLMAARSINNAGKILAQGALGYYLLTPASYASPPISVLPRTTPAHFSRGRRTGLTR